MPLYFLSILLVATTFACGGGDLVVDPGEQKQQQQVLQINDPDPLPVEFELVTEPALKPLHYNTASNKKDWVVIASRSKPLILSLKINNYGRRTLDQLWLDDFDIVIDANKPARRFNIFHRVPQLATWEIAPDQSYVRATIDFQRLDRGDEVHFMEAFYNVVRLDSDGAPLPPETKRASFMIVFD